MRTAGIGLIVLTIVVASAAVSARPPGASQVDSDSSDQSGGPEVGRVRMRDRIVPLTRASLAEGGAASALKEAFATEIMADIEPEHRDTADARDTPKRER